MSIKSCYFPGSLFKVRCTMCDNVTVNRDSPICEALAGKGWVLSTFRVIIFTQHDAARLNIHLAPVVYTVVVGKLCNDHLV